MMPRPWLIAVSVLTVAVLALAVYEAIALHFYFLPLAMAPMCVAVVRAWRMPDRSATARADKPASPHD